MTTTTKLAPIGRQVDHLPVRRMAGAALAGFAAMATMTLRRLGFALAWGTDKQAMSDKIAEMLAIKPGDKVAEIGAGNGAMAVRMARKVGPNGHIYATEIDPARIKQIHERARKARLDNVTVVAATPTNSGLAPGCCDAAYMVDVYHHVTDPAATDASIFGALKPGARLLINDFPPTLWLALFKVKDVPGNRAGHGVTDDLVIKEMTAVGFRELKEICPWYPGWLIRDTYCLVFRKPDESAVTP
jgi:ubiquinone/menaquinone biosynthesis C-methylase UbiE